MNAESKFATTKRSYTYLILSLFAIMFGLSCSIAPGVTFSIFAFFVTGFFIWKFSSQKDRTFLIKLFFFACLIRIIIGLGLHFYSLSKGGYGSIFYDDTGIPTLGWRTVKYYLGDLSSLYDPFGERDIHSNFLAILFYFFGYSRLTGEMFNMLLGALTSIFIYFIALEVFERRTARLSAILVAFFPSLILWSCLNLKDAMIIFLITIVLWAMLKFQREYRIRYTPFMIFPLILLFDLKNYFAALIAMALFIAFLATLRTKLAYRIIILVLVLGLFFKFHYIINRYIAMKYPGWEFNLDMFLRAHRGFTLAGGGTMYRIYGDKFYGNPMPRVNLFSFGFLSAFFRGWYYFMLVPLPWKIFTKLQLIAYPQMIVWIMLLPFSVLGMLFGLRYKLRQVLPIVLFLFILTSAHALSEANVGTAARHRDMLAPFYLIFSAAGIIKIFIGDKNLYRQAQ